MIFLLIKNITPQKLNIFYLNRKVQGSCRDTYSYIVIKWPLTYVITYPMAYESDWSPFPWGPVIDVIYFDHSRSKLKPYMYIYIYMKSRFCHHCGYRCLVTWQHQFISRHRADYMIIARVFQNISQKFCLPHCQCCSTGSGVAEIVWLPPLIARFMGPTLGPPGADRTQVGPMLAPWSLLSGSVPQGV